VVVGLWCKKKCTRTAISVEKLFHLKKAEKVKKEGKNGLEKTIVPPKLTRKKKNQWALKERY